jgi:hypothetical protein
MSGIALVNAEDGIIRLMTPIIIKILKIITSHNGVMPRLV